MTAQFQHDLKVVALAGGVGGARLVDGLHRALPAGSLTVIVNTGDDFRHWGLHISPDIDTIMYTLCGLAPDARGWGIDGDTFHVLAEATRRGESDWFQLGDRDLVTHLSRSAALGRGHSLTDVTRTLCAALGVDRPILPMTDAPRPTIIVTRDGRELAFQHWLIRERAEPAVRVVRFDGSDHATKPVLEALDAADLALVCPSNPYVSIDPILALHGIADRLRRMKTVAVSPIVDGKAVKGPLGTMITDIEGRMPSAEAVAAHYEGLLDGYAIHRGDAFETPLPILETNILIQSKPDRLVLAHELIDFARSLP
jgi:LPPG:FO 2-phospho-L-lactate transferase